MHGMHIPSSGMTLLVPGIIHPITGSGSREEHEP
jgi:hypothetical protein